MTFQLRRFYRSIAQAALILGFSGLVHAAYPDKPIKLIVPYPPGGATDVIGRILAKNLGESLGQQVLVENRSGAGGNIGAEAVAKATPDGYTLLMGAVTSHSTMATLEKGKLRYDILKDFAPVMIVGSVPLVVVVNPNVPVRTLKGLVDYAKANPDKLNYASSGAGAPQRMGAEIFQKEAGIKITHVPYKGSSPALNDLLAGHVLMMFDNTTSSLPQVRSGNLKAIAIAEDKRIAAAPDIPTVAESGYEGFSATPWFGLVTTAGTPNLVIQKWVASIHEVLKNPAIKDRFAQSGVDLVFDTPEAFSYYIESESRKWKEVVRISGARAD
jgi:tripartite-type tricarboxylate transporter receptor subunit TctC